ncbi:MAG TPA: DnaB-like helicase C-terminal domain-containing protein [Candidatus Ozemobacteraceae bacterium]|nr:DnaB-like helicase C-terminal domain-containing protein [Candidatus Ozemobacteraceae bacterium]HQG27652.1 DnaB-like helicase C-terminal domain-containing protein [Candidatus Ozemobacteraceae bacterium]
MAKSRRRATEQENPVPDRETGAVVSLPPAAGEQLTVLDQMLHEMAVDEEIILANLAFDPAIIGKQLRDKRFTVSDFQGVESNRALLGVFLDTIEAEEALNAANVTRRLENERKAGKPLIEWIGRERVQRLFTAPFGAPGVAMTEDIEPVVDRIRDRNVRTQARRLLVLYAEKVARSSDDAYEVLGGCIQELRTLFLQGSAGYIRNMDAHIDEMRELVQEHRQRRKGYIGYETDFPILQERLNGIQKQFYLVTGGVGMGKSTFVTQLAWDLAASNPELTVLYFSLDLNRLDVTAKLVAHASDVPIDYVKNPYLANVAFEQRRQDGLAKVAEMRERLLIIDEGNGRIFLDDVRKLVKRTKLERGGDVAVIIDPIFKIHIKNDRLNFNERCNLLSAELKTISAVEGVTLIATAGLPKAISNRRPVREDLEEIMGLLYDPYVVMFLYCDYLNDFETPFLEWEWGKDNFMIPISELLIAKNKMGAINSRIFFRYYESYSRFRECAPQEVENYNAMIENLEKYKEVKRKNRGPAPSSPQAGGGGRQSGGREDEF